MATLVDTLRTAWRPCACPGRFRPSTKSARACLPWQARFRDLAAPQPAASARATGRAASNASRSVGRPAVTRMQRSCGATKGMRTKTPRAMRPREHGAGEGAVAAAVDRDEVRRRRQRPQAVRRAAIAAIRASAAATSASTRREPVRDRRARRARRPGRCG